MRYNFEELIIYILTGNKVIRTCDHILTNTKFFCLLILNNKLLITYKFKRKLTSFFCLQGVAVIDNDFSHASANITEGGVGYHYVTVRMKSQRHHPLNFEVEIYV